MKSLIKIDGEEYIPTEKIVMGCPWCGCHRYLQVVEILGHGVAVQCSDCWALGPVCENGEGAIVKWNIVLNVKEVG